MFGRKRKASEFDTPYTCTAALTKGAPETKLSMFVMGLGSFVHGQRIKGLLYLAAEAAYIVFMIMTGLHCLYMLGSLGTVEQQEYWMRRSRFICIRREISPLRFFSTE